MVITLLAPNKYPGLAFLKYPQEKKGILVTQCRWSQDGSAFMTKFTRMTECNPPKIDRFTMRPSRFKGMKIVITKLSVVGSEFQKQ